MRAMNLTEIRIRKTGKLWWASVEFPGGEPNDFPFNLCWPHYGPCSRSLPKLAAKCVKDVLREYPDTMIQVIRKDV
jgi:hypothetical protein